MTTATQAADQDAAASTRRAAYQPEEGGAARRVCIWAYDNRDDTLSTADIAVKFGISSKNAVPSLLERAVSTGFLRIEKVEGCNYYSAGPSIDRLNVPASSTAGLELQRLMTSASQPQRAASDKVPASSRKRPGRALPFIDLSAVAVVYDEPLPPRRAGGKGESYWYPLLKRLDRAGAATAPIDIAYRGSITKGIKLYRRGDRAGIEFAVRAVSETHIRVWRTK